MGNDNNNESEIGKRNVSLSSLESSHNESDPVQGGGDELEVVADDQEDDTDEGEDWQQHHQQQQRAPLRCGRFGWLVLHLLCLSFYVVPVFFVSSSADLAAANDPVLDELHIVSPDNKDINGETTLRTIFSNDYWGRPLTFPASHKSWRPLTVLSFRYLKQTTPPILFRIFNNTNTNQDLMSHRFINILTHTCIADLVAILATKLMLPTTAGGVVYLLHSPIGATDMLRVLTKLVFSLHPTHVEVTANAANRGHLLGVLCSLFLADPDVSWWVVAIALVAGFLCSETFLFQVVPAAVTCWAIAYLRQYYWNSSNVTTRRTSSKRIQQEQQELSSTTTTMMPHAGLRCLWLLFGAVTYYGGRYYYDTLSIPADLIRPAENPFFALTGWVRVYSYAHVVAIHVAKAWDWDFVGFSHEYGRECIRPVVEPNDKRLWIFGSIVMAYALVGLGLIGTALQRQQQKQQPRLTVGLVWFFVHVSWMTTLFPITGIVKVGTFISDRIVVAASVSTSILVAFAIFYWLTNQQDQQHHQRHSRKSRRRHQQYLQSTGSYYEREARDVYKLLWLVTYFLFCYHRVYTRALEWSDSISLLESSLQTCPRFAKAHLEISKIYSGLYESHFNLTRSLHHIQQAERFDPDYCDVHQQFAHVLIQQQSYEEFEEHLTQALLCPYTGGQTTMNLWQNYWKLTLDESSNPPAAAQVAKKRYDVQMAVLQQAIAAEQDSKRGGEPGQQAATRSSPLVTGWGRQTTQEL